MHHMRKKCAFVSLNPLSELDTYLCHGAVPFLKCCDNMKDFPVISVLLEWSSLMFKIIALIQQPL